MRYSLLFERFLNPGRKTMPDVDVDFAVAGRERVINYVAEKYGRRNVAQIITFGKMQPKAAIKDAGRVMGIPYGVVDRIAKLVPDGPKIIVRRVHEAGRRAAQGLRHRRDDQARSSTWRMPLEGVVRNDSIHAAAVVIGDRPLTEYLPLQQKGTDSEVVTQFSMGDVEALGLLKMDFLGLRNLDVIDRAVELIEQSSGRAPRHARAAAGRHQDLRDDGPRRCHRRVPVRVGGMRDALRQVRPTGFEDLIALGALYRPGPMQNIPDYAARKNGREPVTYADPRLRADPVGDGTASRVYQEQCMLIAREIWPGSRPPRPTTCARRSARRSRSLMASLKDKFIEGCAAQRRRPRPVAPSSCGTTTSAAPTTPSTRPTPPATR